MCLRRPLLLQSTQAHNEQQTTMILMLVGITEDRIPIIRPKVPEDTKLPPLPLLPPPEDDPAVCVLCVCV